MNIIPDDKKIFESKRAYLRYDLAIDAAKNSQYVVPANIPLPDKINTREREYSIAYNMIAIGGALIMNDPTIKPDTAFQLAYAFEAMMWEVSLYEKKKEYNAVCSELSYPTEQLDENVVSNSKRTFANNMVEIGINASQLLKADSVLKTNERYYTF